MGQCFGPVERTVMEQYVTHGKYFSADEVRCKCGCGVAKADRTFMTLLDALREKLNRPVRLTSFYRCPAHDAAVDGTGNHTTGKAADIAVSGSRGRAEIVRAWTQVVAARNRELKLIGIYPDERVRYRIGVAESFVHVDNVDELETGEQRDDSVLWLYK